MAVIYTFPTKGTPVGADLVLLSDSEDDNNTKNATIASMVASNAIDVVDTVTASGSGITASPNKGNVVITNTGVTSLIQGNGISLSGSTGNITVAFSGSTYVLPLAADGTRGGVQIGYTENAKNYPVELDSEKMFVNVPWTGGLVTSLATVGTSGVSTLNSGVLNIPNYTFTLNTANSSFLGGIKSYINYEDPQTVQLISNTSNRNYGIGINSDQKAFVNVPWPDAVAPEFEFAASSGSASVITSGGTMTFAQGSGITTTSNGSGTITIGATTITASQGLTKNSNNITLDIADPDTGWAILGGGAGASTPVILGLAGINSTGTKNFGITTFTDSASVTSANSNVAMGFDSMGITVSTASNNVVLGTSAGSGMTTALDNVVIGQDAGTGLTAGGENTIVGHDSGNTITTGNKNTLIGSEIVASTGAASTGAVAVGQGNVVTEQSTAIGSGASVTGATGTALGSGASVSAANGIAIGTNCAITDPVLGLASAGNPIQTVSPLGEALIDKYLTVVVNGETRYIALYTGNP